MNQSPVEELRRQRDRFVAFSFASADLLLEVGPAGTIRFASGATKDLTGRPAVELRGVPWVEIFAEKDRGLVLALARALKPGARCGPIAIQLAPLNGDATRPAVFNGYRLPGEENSLYCTVSRSRVPTRREADTGRRDAVTGLLDGESFSRAAEEAMSSAALLGEHLALTMLEFENFAGFETTLSEGARSELMREVGLILRAQSVDGDTSARLGDDKFGVVHQNNVDPAELSRQITALSQSYDPQGRGITVARRTVDLDQQHLDRKDVNRALIYAVQKFSEEGMAFDAPSLKDSLGEMVRDTFQRINELKSTMGRDKFDLAFQPIVSLKDRKLHHYEVLTRVKGRSSPYEMVTFAENVGLAQEFDLAVLRRAMGYLATQPPTLNLAINVSGQSMGLDSFVQMLGAMLAEQKARARQIHLEVTESSEIKDLVRLNAVLQELRAHGCKIGLDDFGAGAASFQYLQALDVDFVKIDGAYVTRVLLGTRDAVMMKALAGLCRELSIETVAERVETEEQAVKVMTLGIDYGQGYLFGKPGPATDYVTPATLPAPPPAAGGGALQYRAKRAGARETWG
ncbi:EAL domain-containing protein [Zavarzinia sp. CC-PAN008]|uniref:EAL domain-containing protein n=1 Tax=Zavarzinia sp. CC-PAN008 TaxID=3243332 RepID=UPI003F74820C